MNNGLVIIAAVLGVLVVYGLLVWWIRKWMIKHEVACLWRSLFLAIFLAPGLLLFGEHASIPVPAFAWMSGASNIYSCMQQGLFCSLKLNLYLSVLPFLATWVFAYFMCLGPDTKENNE